MLVEIGLNQADRFQTAGDCNLDPVQHDALRRDADRLKAGAAEAIDGKARHADRQAGANQGQPRDVVAGCPFGKATAHDNVLDLARGDAGAFHRVTDDMAAQCRAVGIVERAPEGLADRRARRRYDNRLSHEPASSV